MLFTKEASRNTAGNQPGNNERRACKQYPTPCLHARTTIPTTIHLSLQRLNSRSSLNLLTWVVISSDFFPTFFFDQKQLGKLWINVFFYHRFQNNNNKISFWENEILQIFNITKLKQKKETLVLGSWFQKEPLIPDLTFWWNL